MNKRILRTFALSALCCCALAVSASADCIGGAETSTSVNMRSGAGTNTEIVSTLPQGTDVIVESNAGSGWYKVNHNGNSGYMYSEYLTFSETMELKATGWVDGSAVRMRSQANTDSSIVRVTSNGEKVEIIGVAGNWYNVSAGGKMGYIRSDFIALNQDDVTANQTVGDQVVELAKQYMGYSYVWAGASPSTGFDCSGFVSYVFKTLGYQTNRTAADIYKNGTYVEKADLQIGDAVFFGSNSNYIGHIGIYIGDGDFIHSSSGCGYVTISGLDESYYSRMYVGARRIAE